MASLHRTQQTTVEFLVCEDRMIDRVANTTQVVAADKFVSLDEGQ
jgi:hypothetical protein